MQLWLCKVIVNQSIIGICITDITDICIDDIESLIELLTEFAARPWVARGLVSVYVKVSRSPWRQQQQD